MITTFIKAERVDEHTINLLFKHNEMNEQFTVAASNVDVATGEIDRYYLDEFEIFSKSETLEDIVFKAIRLGECDENDYLELYIEIRDAFEWIDCENM